MKHVSILSPYIQQDMEFLTVGTFAYAFLNASNIEAKEKVKPCFMAKPIGWTSNKKLSADPDKSKCYQPKWHFSVRAPTLHMLVHKMTLLDWRFPKHYRWAWNEMHSLSYQLAILPFYVWIDICDYVHSNSRTYVTILFDNPRTVRDYSHCNPRTDLYAGFPWSNSRVIRGLPVSILAYASIRH